MNTRFYTTLEQSKRLKELGVAQQADMFWYEREDNKFKNLLLGSWSQIGGVKEKYAAFSVGELLAMLPDRWYYWYILDDAYKSGMQFRCGDDAESPYYYIGLTPCEAIGSTIISEATHNKEFSIEAINARYLEAIGE